jgi:ornithine cyclodeaminase/alanine dehydrogenase-like protein (mu-crystallin family)
MTLILSESDVVRLADWPGLLAASRSAFVTAALGRSQVPPRIKFPLAGTENRFIVMPAQLVDDGVTAVKVLTVCPANPAVGLPAVGGIAVLIESANGEVRAIISAAALTDLRTAAGSATAAGVLARSDSQVLTIIGAGRLAVAHARALAHLFDLAEIRVVSRTLESAEQAARSLSADVAADVIAVKTVRAAARGADVIVTATSSSNPVLYGSWLSEGTHICAVGAAAPSRRELDTTVIDRAVVIVSDTVAGALDEAGDLIVPVTAGRLNPGRIVEIGEILLDPSRGRQTPEQITIFKGIGSAVVDAAAASMLYERALLTGVGLQISLS